MLEHSFPNLTPSKVSALGCLKQYYTLHVLHEVPQMGFAQPLAFGAAIHETLKSVYVRANPIPPKERNIPEIAQRAICRCHYPDLKMRDADLARCIACVKAYREQTPEDEETIGVELFDSLAISGGIRRRLTLGAKFDRLLVRASVPEHLVIRDYKTGKPRELEIMEAAIMLAIIAARFKDYASYTLEYDYLGISGLSSRRIVTYAEAKAAWPDLKAQALRVYNASEFPAEPGEQCMFCPLRSLCQPEMTLRLEELDELLHV